MFYDTIRYEMPFRAGFKGGRGANWAVAQGPPQLRGLHKNSIKIITYENMKILLQSLKVNIDIFSYYYN